VTFKKKASTFIRMVSSIATLQALTTLSCLVQMDKSHWGRLRTRTQWWGGTRSLTAD